MKFKDGGKPQYRSIPERRSDPCIPLSTDKAQGGPYSQSLSNIEESKPDAVPEFFSYNPAIRIIPNPFTDRAVVLFNNNPSEEYSFTIADITGKVVCTQTGISGNRFEIIKGDLPAGMYVIEVRGNTICKTRLMVY